MLVPCSFVSSELQVFTLLFNKDVCDAATEAISTLCKTEAADTSVMMPYLSERQLISYKMTIFSSFLIPKLQQ